MDWRSSCVFAFPHWRDYLVVDWRLVDKQPWWSCVHTSWFGTNSVFGIEFHSICCLNFELTPSTVCLWRNCHNKASQYCIKPLKVYRSGFWCPCLAMENKPVTIVDRRAPMCMHQSILSLCVSLQTSTKMISSRCPGFDSQMMLGLSDQVCNLFSALHHAWQGFECWIPRWSSLIQEFQKRRQWCDTKPCVFQVQRQWNVSTGTFWI